jgi:hypothetical protein
MTPYTPQDIAENWEFKILRSAASQFRNPAWLRSILEEEARAGWIMIEKFDNSRVRLKTARQCARKRCHTPVRSISHLGGHQSDSVRANDCARGPWRHARAFLLIMFAAGAFSR